MSPKRLLYFTSLDFTSVELSRYRRESHPESASRLTRCFNSSKSFGSGSGRSSQSPALPQTGGKSCVTFHSIKAEVIHTFLATSPHFFSFLVILKAFIQCSQPLALVSGAITSMDTTNQKRKGAGPPPDRKPKRTRKLALAACSRCRQGKRRVGPLHLA